MAHSQKILITGATGFLGSNLTKALLSKGYEVHVLKRTQSDLFRLKEVMSSIQTYNIGEAILTDIFEQVKPDMVVHCATDYGRKEVDPSVVIEANLILPLRLLELCQKNGVKAFINTDTFLDKGINYYSLSKKQFKEWLATYSSALICINMTLEHFYGPFDDRTKFVSFIIEKMLARAESIDLTEGNQKRDFVFIDDVIEAFLKVIEQVGTLENGVYEFGVGTNKQIPIRELVEMLQKITDNTTTRLNFGAIPYRKNEVMESNIDTFAIKKLGWEARHSLKDGLLHTVSLEKQIRK